MTQDDAWTFCKLRAQYRAEHRAEVRRMLEDVFMVASGFLWFFGLLALAGILQ